MRAAICIICMMAISMAWPLFGMLTLGLLGNRPVIGCLAGAGLVTGLWIVFTYSRWWHMVTKLLRWFFGLFDIPYMQHATFPTTGPDVLGYGWVNNWMNLSRRDNEKLAEHMHRNRLNTYMVEFYGYGRDEWCNHPGELLKRFEAMVPIYHAYRIAIWIKFINWNVGDGDHAENGRIGPCDERYSLHTLSSICGMCYRHGWQDGVIIEPATEWPQGKCPAKARELHNWIAHNWSGPKAWNEDSRPSEVPDSGWMLDYHINGPGRFGNNHDNKVITTDTSAILNWLGGLHNYASDHHNLRALVGECRRRGHGFILYGFDAPGVDWDAIKIIGDCDS